MPHGMADEAWLKRLTAQIFSFLFFLGKAQSAAFTWGAHADASSSAAAEHKVPLPSLACTTSSRAPPAQRRQFECFKPAAQPSIDKVVEQTGDAPEEFS